ncbi:MAG: hypothetical protein N4A45_02560 [Flavobacteriales bacterium]|jgi:TRAP-type C4-dicarboxylate transport system permease small subunit|nr:hypothetical protein [Flavobacteriales bacterium]
MNKNLSKILMVVVAILMLVGVYYYFQIVSNGDDAFDGNTDLQDSVIGPALSYTLWVIYIAAGISLVFSVVNMLKQPKNLIPIGGAILGLLVIYFIASGQASDVVETKWLEFDVDAAVSKNVGTGLFSFYWIAAVAIVGAIVGEIYSAIK